MVAAVSALCRKGEAGGAGILQKESPLLTSRRQGLELPFPLSEGHLCSLPAACAPSPFPRRTLGPAQHFILSYFEGRRGGLKLVVEPNHSLLCGSHRPLPHPCFQVAKETTQPIRSFGFVPVQPRKLWKANSVLPGSKSVGRERPLCLEASCRDALPHSCAHTHAHTQTHSTGSDGPPTPQLPLPARRTNGSREEQT